MAELLDRRALAEALGHHGIDLDPGEFIAVFEEAVDDSTETLSSAEQEFLVTHGGVNPAALAPEAQAAARARLTVETARADARAARRGLSTREVADMLSTAPANVRRAASQGDLYAAGRGRNREHIFPAWQFADGQPLGHLRQVLAVLPGELHPLDVETFMSTADESLGERSPAEWLAGGGEPAPVIRLADELGWV